MFLLGPRNTHEKKFGTHETSTRKNLRHTKYPREKFSDSLRHDGTVTRDPRDTRWHETHGI